MTDKKIAAISTPDIDPLQKELVTELQRLLTEARAGRLIGLIGVAVFEDEDGDQNVSELDEGYSLDLADVILMLKYKTGDLMEDWVAEKILGLADDDN
jgi:hypothetical protein